MNSAKGPKVAWFMFRNWFANPATIAKRTRIQYTIDVGLILLAGGV